MFEAKFENRVDVVVIKRIEDHLSVSACSDNPHLAEVLQMLGDSGLLHLQQHAQVADAHFGLAQGAQDANPGPVGKQFEELRHVVQVGLGGHLLGDLPDRNRVDNVTEINFRVAFCP